MNKTPKCVIVTGHQGAGKTTLSKELAQRLWMPVVSCSEIKEGYVNTLWAPARPAPLRDQSGCVGLFL